MSRKLMLLAAIPMLFAVPAFGQTDDPAASDMETQAPAAGSDMAPSEDTGSTDMSGAATDAPASESAADEPPAEGEMPSDTAEGDAMETDTTAASAGSGEVEIMTEEAPDQILVERIIGTQVLDSEGNEIGTVEDVVLNTSGMINGLVLSSGAILGLGGKTVAITWDDVRAAEGESITINMTEEQISAAPEFRTKEQQEEEAMSSEPAAGGTGTDPAAGGAALPSPDPEPATQ